MMIEFYEKTRNSNVHRYIDTKNIDILPHIGDKVQKKDKVFKVIDIIFSIDCLKFKVITRRLTRQ